MVDDFGGLRTAPPLLAKLREAAKRSMTADEVREQRVSWIVGQTGCSRAQAIAAVYTVVAHEAASREPQDPLSSTDDPQAPAPHQPAQMEAREGWVTVPDSATHKMLNAANTGRKKCRSSSGDIYRAMIEAAPKLVTPPSATTEAATQATGAAQEPVAWMRINKFGNADICGADCFEAFPVYRAATLPAEPLTKAEVDRIVAVTEVFQYRPGAIEEFATEVQRAFATKNGIGITPKAKGRAE